MASGTVTHLPRAARRAAHADRARPITAGEYSFVDHADARPVVYRAVYTDATTGVPYGRCCASRSSISERSCRRSRRARAARSGARSGAQVAGSSWARTNSARINVAQKANQGIISVVLTLALSAGRGPRFSVGSIGLVSWLSLALLVCAVAVVDRRRMAKAERAAGSGGEAQAERARRKSQLRVLRSETDDFAASVERDLDQLPTIEDFDRRN